MIGLGLSCASAYTGGGREKRPIQVQPDFVIIGAQRCGTSSLYACLVQHPMVAPASRKEVHYFDLNYDKGIDWYRGHFRAKQGPRVLSGEASPYYLFHPLAAQRCAETVPGAKIIVLLRNPADRAYSHYHHEVRKGRETLSFEEALDREQKRLEGGREKLISDPAYRSRAHQSYSYRARGVYADQLKDWMDRFPRERMLIMESERFFENPSAEHARVLEFLGLPLAELGVFRQWNRGSYDPMPAETKQRLADYFEPHNQRLGELLGARFRWCDSSIAKAGGEASSPWETARP